jgi:hypothetical protein
LRIAADGKRSTRNTAFTKPQRSQAHQAHRAPNTSSALCGGHAMSCHNLIAQVGQWQTISRVALALTIVNIVVW